LGVASCGTRESAVDTLSEKNVELALVEFAGPYYNTPRVKAYEQRANFDNYYTQYGAYFGIIDFTNDTHSVISFLSMLTPLFKWTEPSADAVYIAASNLTWDMSDNVARIIVLAVDECDQYLDYTHEEAVEAARDKNITIYVVRPKKLLCYGGKTTGYPQDDYARATGGKVFILGVNASDLGSALLNIVENITLPPAVIETRLDYLGIFKSSTITITGLYPEDRIIIVAPNKTTSIVASGSVIDINLINYLSPTEIVTALLSNSLYVAIHPSTEHLLSLLPDRALVHVRSENVDKWIEVPLYVHFACSVLHGAVNGDVRVISNDGTFTVYVNGMNVGTYPALEIAALGYEQVEIVYKDGSRRIISPGDLVQIGAQQMRANERLDILLYDSIPVYEFGKATLVDISIVKELHVEGGIILVDARLSK